MKYTFMPEKVVAFLFSLWSMDNNLIILAVDKQRHFDFKYWSSLTEYVLLSSGEKIHSKIAVPPGSISPVGLLQTNIG